MADATEDPAGTAPVLGGDHSADMSREDKLQAIGEHTLALDKLHGQHDDHVDAIDALVGHIRDGDGRGGDGEQGLPIAREARLTSQGSATHAAIMRSYRGAQ
jgi:hypothetical protein